MQSPHSKKSAYAAITKAPIGTICAVVGLSIAPAYAQPINIQPASTNTNAPLLQQDLRTINNYYSNIHNAIREDAPLTAQTATQPQTPAAPNITPQSQQAVAPVNTGYGAFGRDPFAVTNQIHQTKNNSANRYNFVPHSQSGAGQSSASIPSMQMKGLVRDANGQIAALLDIAGSGIHIVRPNDTVGLHNLGSNAVLKIRSIDSLSVVVELGSLGQVVIVR